MRDVLWLENADVHVAVKDGVVTMEGRVPRKSEAEMLRELVQRLGGVVAVEAEISYAEDDTRSPSDPAPILVLPGDVGPHPLAPPPLSARRRHGTKEQ